MKSDAVSRICAALCVLALLPALAFAEPFGESEPNEPMAGKYMPFVPTDPVMPISRVKPGMKGECRTVVRGTKVVAFDAEVVDVIPNQGNPRHLILVRASGPLIEQTGGIAAGMSGSPFYIGGKLVGAIGYGWPFSRHDLGLVTPIEDMIALWDNPEMIPSFEPAPIIPDKPPVRSGDESLPSSMDKLLERLAASDDAEPGISDLVITSSDVMRTSDDVLAAPLFVSGVSSRMAGRMGEILGREVTTFGGGSFSGGGSNEAGGSKMAKYDAVLKPGMAVGASILWGDVEVSSIGTLTALSKDGRFIAFAHPFLSLGATSAVLTEASISSVVPGLQTPFKLGTTGDIIGIVTQDRPQGIGGRVGRFAPAASCAVNVLDVDSGRRYQRRFQVLQDMYLLSKLMPAAIVGSIEDLWGRIGGGSAKITATYSGNALPGGWKRTNVFVSDKDVANDMLAEFNLMTQVFAVNQFQELRPFGVNVEVELTQMPRVLYIDDVETPKGPFHPGERVSFDITLRPWRKPPFIRTYSLVVPEKVTGICELLIRGGGIAEENAEYMEAAWRSISSLPILLKEIDAKETNDQIVLEIRGQEALADQIKKAQKGDPEDLMNDKLKSEIREEKMAEGSMRIIRTNYYVDGIIHRLIKVEGGIPDGQDEKEEDT
ncbi:MAG: hypothetical protein LBO21_03215 [Synergistaceae bacterium]|nr:hypothetical protein [Synergistaceae bacterium]